MIIIGEKINSTAKSVYSAIESRDAIFIQDLARRQVVAGVDYIDVNAGMFYGFEDEPERLAWLVRVVQAAVGAPLCIDTPNPSAMEAALIACNGMTQPILNSITAEKPRMESMLPLALHYRAKIIALCIDDNGVPETSSGRCAVAMRLIDQLAGAGIRENDIFIDPLVMPIAIAPSNGTIVFDAIRHIRMEHPGVHIVCGISNSSFGLPRRNLINQAYMICAMAAGLDCAIIDTLDKYLLEIIAAAEAVLGINGQYQMINQSD